MDGWFTLPPGGSHGRREQRMNCAADRNGAAEVRCFYICIFCWKSKQSLGHLIWHDSGLARMRSSPQRLNEHA